MWLAGLAACGILVPLPGIEPKFPALEGGILVCLFWLCWVFVAAWVFSLVAASSGSSLVVVHGLFIAVASLIVQHGLQSCQASVIVAPGLESTGSMWHTSLVAPGHVGSSWTKD